MLDLKWTYVWTTIKELETMAIVSFSKMPRCISIVGEDCLKIIYMAKIKKKATLWGFEPATVKTKVRLRITVTVTTDRAIRPFAYHIYEITDPYLFIDLSMNNPCSIDLSSLQRLFLLFDYDWLRNFGIWEIYDELTLNGQCLTLHVNLSLRFSWFPACIASIR